MILQESCQDYLGCRKKYMFEYAVSAASETSKKGKKASPLLKPQLQVRGLGQQQGAQPCNQYQ
eukprot:2477981-Amphidinium_carterae.1